MCPLAQPVLPIPHQPYQSKAEGETAEIKVNPKLSYATLYLIYIYTGIQFITTELQICHTDTVELQFLDHPGIQHGGRHYP